MAHKKAGGAKARQGTNTAGKRLGLKVSGGQTVKAGTIITRQIGNKLHPFKNVGQGRDFTLFAKKEGIVHFKLRNGKKVVEIV